MSNSRRRRPRTCGRVHALGISNALIISGATVDENFARAAMNIPNVDVLPVAGLNVYDILRRKTLVIPRKPPKASRPGCAPAQKA